MNLQVKTPRKARYFDFAKGSADSASPSAKETKPSAPSVHVDVSCPICQEPVGQPTPEGTTESWSQLPCGHKFGSHCIKHYLGLVADDRPSCPVCRQNATHACGHPVLPEMIAENQRSKSSGAKAKAKAAARSDMLQFTNCDFCQADVVRTRKKKRLKPWRLVKGCWRLIRHGRIRERNRPAPQAPVFAYFPRVRDMAWERWWSNQEPRNA